MAFDTLYLRDGRTLTADEIVPMSSHHGKGYFVHPAGQHNGAQNSWRFIWEYELHPEHRITVGGGCGHQACVTVREQFIGTMFATGFVLSF